jgi:hypothetical protein
MNARILAGLALLLTTGMAASVGPGGEAKPEPKRFLPADVYKKLLGRQAFIIQTAGNKDDLDSIVRAKVAALMIAEATLCVKDDNHKKLAAMRASALKLAEVLGSKIRQDEGRKQFEALLSGEGDSSLKDQGTDFKKYVSSKLALMVMYMPKDKGGEGLHADLQVSPRLKGGEEFIENLFSYLGKKALKPKQLDQAANELRLIAYRTAVSGELIDTYAPEKKTKKRDPEVWHKTSRAMVDSALALAQAALKRDAAGVQQAASRVTESCVQCHKMFQ